MDAVSDIKARINIEDLVSQYVPLKKVGRQFKALCPFHKERTPSFYVSPERGIAYCFGCRKGGDIFKFVQEIEGLDFVGSLKFLAEKAGIELPQRSFRAIAKDSGEKKSQRDRLIAIHEEATAFFETQLFDTDDGKKVLKYLNKRGLAEEIIRTARLGFASGASGGEHLLYNFLLKKDFTREEILASGLIIARDMDGSCVDRFRMRLMFPIRNLAGNICAYGGRAIRDGDEPKYLNSPETPIYHKSSLLFGLSEARAEIRQTGRVIIVEGYMDALTAHQSGFTNTVACSGTALTEDQLVLLKRFSNELILAFDRDNAGKLATARSIELSLEKEFSVRVAVWKSDAKDPDECIRSDKKIFEDAIQKAEPALEYLLSEAAKSNDPTSVKGKKEMLEVLLPYLGKVKSPVELDEWLKKLSHTTGISLQALYDELKRFQGKQKVFSRVLDTAPKSEDFGILYKREEYLLGLLLTYHEAYSIANQIVTPEDFEDRELQNIYRSLSTQYNQNLDDQESKRADILALLAETRHADMTWDAVSKEVSETARAIIRYKLEREKRSLVTILRTANGKDKEEFLNKYQELLEKEKKL